MVRLIAGASDLAIPAIVKVPVALQLGTRWFGVQICRDVGPCQSAVAVHVVAGDGIGDALVTERWHKNSLGVSWVSMASSIPASTSSLRKSSIKDGEPAKQQTTWMSSSAWAWSWLFLVKALECLGARGEADFPAGCIRSAPPGDAEHRCRRRCSATWSTTIGDRPAPARHATTLLRDAQARQL